MSSQEESLKILTDFFEPSLNKGGRKFYGEKKVFFPDQWHILSPRQCERKLHLKLLHARHLSYIQVGTQEYRGN